MDQIIKSNLEQDLYKDSMGQTIFHQFNSYMTEWTFKSRNKDVTYTPEMVGEIARQIELYCKLRYTKDELDWIVKTFEWIHKDYVNSFLRLFQPDPSEIFINGVCLALGADKIPSTDYGCGLSIELKGPWLTTSRYEVPILAIVNEVYFAKKYGEGKKDIEFQERTIEKFRKLENHEYDIGWFSEFGMRRRYSGPMQDWLVGFLAEHKECGKLSSFVGTSNMFLAKKYGTKDNGIKAVGTMAHEFIMCVGQGNRMYNPAYSNKLMLDAWHREYGTMNGIALTDTIGTDAFLLDFQKTYCRVFDGVRHDSGDPLEWAKKMVANYQKHGVNPHDKTLLFSDSLDFERATRIYKEVKPYAGVAFGIGTYLSNPLDNPLNIVMKVTKCNGHDVAKLSDVEGKGMCKNDKYVAKLREQIAERIEESKEVA